MRITWFTAVSAVALAGCGSAAPPADDGDGGSSGIASITLGEGSATQGSATAGPEDGSATQASADGGTGDTGEIKFDLGAQPDANLGCDGGGGGGGGTPDFSYIWIANSNESTVSKINTESLIEEGRYLTRPDGNGNPSRTSVNLNGDAVVANRSGGVTMLFARTEQCPDPLNTSTGSADVKPWPDGCVGWHTPMAYNSQRPVAWTAGTFDNGTCRYEDTKVWTSGANDPQIDVVLLDGETGVVEQTVAVNGLVASFFGIYGGAVDSEDNFWGSQLGVGRILRVDRGDFSQQNWVMPVAGYGMAVDRNDRVWTCSNSVGRFDYPTQTWQTAVVGGANGCMPDGGDLLWISGDPMVGVDIETLAVAQTLDVPNSVRGISIDFNGYVWGPSLNANAAYRVDPMTGQIDTVAGLNYPYTYSDMTGFGLSQVGGPSG